MLRVTKLSKRFGSRLVFRDVNFEIPGGAIVALTGSNGSGKSTLLRILAGLIRPSHGEVSFSQNEKEEYSAPGLFAPDAPVYRELTVLENLQFFARALPIQNSLPPEMTSPIESTLERAPVAAQLEFFNLQNRQHQLAGDLSSGWRARLQLAVATLGDPKVLLLDEPSAHLDSAGLDLLHAVHDAQRARGLALVATNDARESSRCDFCVEL